MSKWIRSHRLIMVVVGIVAALWLCNWVLFGLSLDFFAKQRLLSAQTAWESQSIDDYQMIIQVDGFQSFRTQYFVNVRDNQVIEAAQKGMTSLIDRDYDPASVPFSPMPVENASRFTIDNLFSYANSELENDIFIHINDACNRYEADFDPQMSFISLYSNWCDSSLLGCGISHCAFSYRVIELEPLYEDTD